MNLAMFNRYSRQEWQQLHKAHYAIEPIHNLTQFVSLNDRLSQEDIEAIYIPLIDYIDLSMEHRNQTWKATQQFLAQESDFTPPFIIGISGSVAVGKSTTARVLRELLARAYPQKKVDLMTTDGFLFPNKELIRRNLLNRKGFPESYDMPKLLDCMIRLKTTQEPVYFPKYSHKIYDIIPDEQQMIHQPDILIVEGINVLQLPENQRLYVSDFFDLSIYIDASHHLIQQWFLERFNLLMDLAQQDETAYYHALSKLPREQALSRGTEIWRTINLVNLLQNIEPTRERASVILHKTTQHLIDAVYIRQY